MSDYAKAAASLDDLRRQAAEAFGVGRQFLALCREAGLPEPKVYSYGPGQTWNARFDRQNGYVVAWVGVLGGIDLRAVDGYGPVVFARDRTPEQAVQWLREMLK